MLSIGSERGEGETNRSRQESSASVKVVKTTPGMVTIARKSVQEKPGWCCSDARSQMAMREIRVTALNVSCLGDERKEIMARKVII